MGLLHKRGGQGETRLCSQFSPPRKWRGRGLIQKRRGRGWTLAMPKVSNGLAIESKDSEGAAHITDYLPAAP